MNEQWLFSRDHNQLCRVIETQVLWGVQTSLVFLPGLNRVERIHTERLLPIDGSSAVSEHAIVEKAAVAKISGALSQNTLLAPITSSVIPLPHQLRALTRAMAHDRVRYLFADEVGLGKTIEAGLVMRELKLRGLAERILVIAPKSLAVQWVAEMRAHFNEEFRVVTPEEIQSLYRLLGQSGEHNGGQDRVAREGFGAPAGKDSNPWKMFSRIVVPMDSVKPLERRRGWNALQIAEYNAQRYEDMICAGWEGLNLQFCHVVINYDMPWNPMRVEQRIGRVDRIGQPKMVKALNFILNDSVEMRVQEVLEEKLAVILEEFGVDKTGDVLDSAQAGQIFDDLYVRAIMNPQALEESVDNVVTEIRSQTEIHQESIATLSESEELDPGAARNLLNHPLPYWVELMTVNHTLANGGKAVRKKGMWKLTWHSDVRALDAVFNARDAAASPTAVYLSLENPRIRELIQNPVEFADGSAVPCVTMSAISKEISGLWSTWLIALDNAKLTQRRILTLFEHIDGRILIPTANRILDELLSGAFEITGHLSGDDSRLSWGRCFQMALEHGREHYESLINDYDRALEREDRLARQSFESRRKTIERLGLDTVRNYRLRQLRDEEQLWLQNSSGRVRPAPTMKPLLVMTVN